MHTGNILVSQAADCTMKQNDSPLDKNKFIVTHNFLNHLCGLSNAAGIKAVVSCNTHSLLLIINTTCQSITQHFILYTIKIVYCQGDMFQPLLRHLQAVWENRYKSYLYFNALWDPKCIHTILFHSNSTVLCTQHFGMHSP